LIEKIWTLYVRRMLRRRKLDLKDGGTIRNTENAESDKTGYNKNFGKL